MSLVMTKPLGFGVTTHALKREMTSPVDVKEVTVGCNDLNKQASQLGRCGVKCGTDVTDTACWAMA